MATAVEQPAAGADPFAPVRISRQQAYQRRIQLFEDFQRAQREIAEREPKVEINVTLPDGQQRKAVKGVTTPMDLAKQISSGLAKKATVAEVVLESDPEKKQQPWDMMRPLQGNCSLKLFTFDDPEGREVGEL